MGRHRHASARALVLKGPTARDVAARVLVRVVRDESFAAAALEAELGRAVQLEPRDRALATELVYGTLRVLPWIIAELDARAKKPTSGLPWEARGALWVAMQQIQFMRVPAFAAVDEAVSAVRRAAGPRVAGFANALLRRAAEARAKITTDAEANELRARAVRESCPRDMRDALAAALGEEDAARFLEETETPPMGLRVRDAASREGVMKKLAAARPNAELHEGRVSPLCILARGLGKPQSLDEFRSGEIIDSRRRLASDRAFGRCEERRARARRVRGARKQNRGARFVRRQRRRVRSRSAKARSAPRRFRSPRSRAERDVRRRLDRRLR